MTVRGLLLPVAVALAVTLPSCASPADRGGSPFRPRPYAVDVAVVDPCRALTPEQESLLRVLPGAPGVAMNGASRGCTWVERGRGGYNLQTLPVGAAEALTEPTARVVTVNGFGAAQSLPDRGGRGLLCQVVLDVADGTALRVQYETRDGAADPEGACARVRTAAGRMLDTLRAQQP